MPGSGGVARGAGSGQVGGSDDDGPTDISVASSHAVCTSPRSPEKTEVERLEAHVTRFRNRIIRDKIIDALHEDLKRRLAVNEHFSQLVLPHDLAVVLNDIFLALEELSHHIGGPSTKHELWVACKSFYCRSEDINFRNDRRRIVPLLANEFAREPEIGPYATLIQEVRFYCLKVMELGWKDNTFFETLGASEIPGAAQDAYNAFNVLQNIFEFYSGLL